MELQLHFKVDCIIQISSNVLMANVCFLILSSNEIRNDPYFNNEIYGVFYQVKITSPLSNHLKVGRGSKSSLSS